MARSCKSDNKDYVEITFYEKCSIIACILFAISSNSKASPLNANGTRNSYESKLISYNQTIKYDDPMNIKKSNQFYNMSHNFNRNINWLKLNDSNYKNISYTLPLSKNNYSKLESNGNDNVNRIGLNQCIGFESDMNMQILPMPSTEIKYSESADYEFTHRKKRPQSIDNLSAQDINSVKHIKTIESGLYNTSDHRSTIKNSKNIENKIHKNETGSLHGKKESKKSNHSRVVHKKDLTKNTALKKKELNPKIGPEKLIKLKSFIDQEISDQLEQKGSKLKLNYNDYSDFDSYLSHSILSKQWIDDNQLNLITTRRVNMNLFIEKNDGLRSTDSSYSFEENDDDLHIPEGLLRELENRDRLFDIPDREQIQDVMGEIGGRNVPPSGRDSEGSQGAPDDEGKPQEGTHATSCTDVCEAKTLVVVFVGTTIGLIVVVTLSFYWWKFSQNTEHEICVECVPQCNR